MDGLEMFTKIRDISSEIVEAWENDDAEKLESSMGKFMFLMAQLDALK